MDIPVYNMAGEIVDRLEIDQAALGGEPNRPLIRQAVLLYEANQRVGTAAVKNRRDVSGSGRKPWRQKHAGRARHGTTTSPIWVGGGVTHGPVPRDYRKKMNKDSRRRALYSAFLAKARDGEVLAVQALELPEAKTSAMADVLKKIGVERTFLVVMPEANAEMWRCTRNIPGSHMMAFKDLNAYTMICPQKVVFTLEAIQSFLAAAPSQKSTVKDGATSDE